MANSLERAQLIKDSLARTEELFESITRRKPILQEGHTFRQKLVNAQESGQPIPLVILSNGPDLNNVVITEVGLDSVVFTDPLTNNTAIANIQAIVRFGTL